MKEKLLKKSVTAWKKRRTNGVMRRLNKKLNIKMFKDESGAH